MRSGIDAPLVGNALGFAESIQGRTTSLRDSAAQFGRTLSAGLVGVMMLAEGNPSQAADRFAQASSTIYQNGLELAGATQTPRSPASQIPTQQLGHGNLRAPDMTPPLAVQPALDTSGPRAGTGGPSVARPNGAHKPTI